MIGFPSWWLLPQALNGMVFAYILGCPPSKDASGKWRFTRNIIILVVTATEQGDNPMYIQTK